MNNRICKEEGENVDYPNNDISKHFKKRYRSRTGLGKKGMERFIEKAKKYGLYESDITNSKLKHYIKEKVISLGATRQFIIYNTYIIIFTKNIYITILHLPNEYCKIAQTLQKQKRDKIECK
jgi:hypothetical protein